MNPTSQAFQNTVVASAPEGCVAIVLHAHLPYVRHPEYERCLEEVWFFDALTECYLPLLDVFERLTAEGVSYRVSLSLSPPLLEMMADPLMQMRYEAHLHRLIELSVREQVRLQEQPVYLKLAKAYQKHFEKTLHRFSEVYQRDLIAAFSAVEAGGGVELMTTAATHGFLPLFQHQSGAIHAQVQCGVQTFRRHFGHAPQSFWLPECGYFPGIESALAAAGVSNSLLDTHGVTGAHPPPPQGCYAPIRSEGITFFPRDPEASRQVWSSREGYPGDFDYREYYSDIGLNLPLEAVSGFCLPDGTRIPSGIKYDRVSGENREKQPYDPAQATRKARQHALHFIKSRLQRLDASVSEAGAPPVLMVAPYDAELFGHWWFEGPQWLEQVLRGVAETPQLRTVSLSDYAGEYAKCLHPATPAASSWGQAGFNRFWLNEDTAWIFPQLHEAYDRLCALIARHADAPMGGLQERAIKQAARTLLLAQSSDWPFIIRAKTTTQYAVRRIQEELARFRYLEHGLQTESVEERKLAALETLDAVFPDLQLHWFSSTIHRSTQSAV